jgi:AcrR family transcriptional regulator
MSDDSHYDVSLGSHFNSHSSEVPLSRAMELLPRKRPRQRRSKATVEAILEATARVLVEEGLDRASTNRIAEIAGVSIGSLYQYFPSKDALVMALLERHCERMLGLLLRSSVDLADAPLEEAVRTYVRAIIEAHAFEPKLHQVLILQAITMGLDHVAAIEQQARATVVAFLERRQSEILPDDLEMAAYVLVSAVEAATHRALLENPHDVPWESMEREICALILRYLRGHAPGDTPRRAGSQSPAGARATTL